MQYPWAPYYRGYCDLETKKTGIEMEMEMEMVIRYAIRVSFLLPTTFIFLFVVDDVDVSCLGSDPFRSAVRLIGVLSLLPRRRLRAGTSELF